MKLSKLVYVIGLSTIFFVGTGFSGPCDFEIFHKVTQAQNGDFQISLEARGDGGFFKIQLYDLYTGQVVEEKQLALSTNNEKVIFESVKPSRYTIYVSSASCPKRKSLGGIEGIKVGN